MTRVLVTGATGFIGRNLVERLIANGDSVHCLVRNKKREERLSGLKAHVIIGDLFDASSVANLLSGMDVVYHLAGATQVVSPKDFIKGNGLANQILANACASMSQPPRVVFVSSLAASGPSLDGRLLTEDDPVNPVSEYGRSKLVGEQHFRKVADRVPVSIVRPPSVFGPWDHHTLALFQSVSWGVHFVPGWRDLRLSWVHVSDLVDSLLTIARRGQRLSSDDNSRGIYFIALNEYPTFSEIGRLAADAQKVKLRFTIYVPKLMCWLFAGLNDLSSKWMRRPHLFGIDKIKEGLSGSWLCSSEKARQELGVNCRVSIEQGFNEVVDWYRKKNWLNH